MDQVGVWGALHTLQQDAGGSLFWGKGLSYTVVSFSDSRLMFEFVWFCKMATVLPSFWVGSQNSDAIDMTFSIGFIGFRKNKWIENNFLILKTVQGKRDDPHLGV